MLATGGKVRRYRGDIPRISPVALLSAAQGIARMNAMAKKVPVDAPWDAPKAARWDAHVGAGVAQPRRACRPGSARDLIEATVRACFAADLSEVSLLNWLFLARSAGGVESLMTIAGGYQDSQFEGGVRQVPDAMAAELGDAVVRSCPGRRRDPARRPGRSCAGDRATVSARRVVLALPRALAAGIRFDPVLPADHALLIHQMPAGTEVKMVAIYDEPFWRADGVSRRHGGDRRRDRGHPRHDAARPSARASSPATRPGRGPAPWPRSARANVARPFVTHAHHPPRARRRRRPLEVLEQNWAEEQWTRGCSMGHFPTGVLTQYGRRLREPVGRLHWAGTETASTSYGAMDGAVRSGERVCEEILAAGLSRAYVTARPRVATAPCPRAAARDPEPTPSFSRKKVSVWSSAARVGVPSLSTRCSVSTECAFLGCP